MDDQLPPEFGSRDHRLGGWFNTKTGELFTNLAIRSSDVVLDVGCGDGRLAHFCALQGAHIILADIDSRSLNDVQRRLAATPARAVEAIVTDSNPLPLEDEVASIVICTEVIEHVDDCEKLFAELARVGRSGARYLLSVPDPVLENLQKPIAAPAHWEKPNHVRIVERDQFARLATDAGLSIETHVFGGFFWSIWQLFFWMTDNDTLSQTHPLLENWNRTWEALLETPRGADLKALLDAFLPKSQIIVARKP